MEIIILENSIKLIPMTSELYHKERMNYIADPMMCDIPYVYDRENAQKDFDKKIHDKNRRWFAIVQNTNVIGNVYYKNINFEKKTAVLSIALTQDIHKGKGYGTVVEKKMLEYGVNQLGLQIVYADTVLRNTRSQHVLEKVGFKYINEDSDFIYYEYTKN
ncbi:GNAT family N-acetyltransferase [Anaerocolumna sp. AGMB13025]|uniref:GNAT family N-acetyltransferase n=1 Tax=Anaerocolumna sp. AGMB13025 TaxID=3039116 RepID=UPI00241CCACF|nr:GNAT family N-acetyltransferase [Anaerocolumna sp. AGMB13025]WFR58144.1 GNAT family N-acetyltransferase [Anaerocolumna sp. AGMB13025]